MDGPISGVFKILEGLELLELDLTDLLTLDD